MKAVDRIFGAVVLLGSVSSVLARSSNFFEPHLGVLTGAGTYFHPLVNDNAFDPVPALTPSGTVTEGSAKTRLLPVKFGFFKDFGEDVVDVYAIYQTNLASTWKASGDQPGKGSNHYYGFGGGVHVATFAWVYPNFRLGLGADFEYVKQKATLTFLPEGGGTDILSLATTVMTLGVGPQMDVWLGEFYVLSLFGGYQYGRSYNWATAKAGSLFGQPFAAGALTAQDGGSVRSQFGGLLVQATLKLNFP